MKGKRQNSLYRKKIMWRRAISCIMKLSFFAALFTGSMGGDRKEAHLRRTKWEHI